MTYKSSCGIRSEIGAGDTDLRATNARMLLKLYKLIISPEREYGQSRTEKKAIT